jgi:hypothetical protein
MKVVLVACGKSKRPEACPARELYTGTLFRKARAWAERHGDAWAILSARHGWIKHAIERSGSIE